MAIDAHQHFWRYDPVEYGWIGDGMEMMQCDRLPADLRPLLDQAGIDKTIAVQARQTLAETEWLLELADQHDWIAGVVGWVDLRSDGLDAQLERFASNPKFVGVRHVVQDEPDDEFMLQPAFLKGVERLAAFDLSYDILIFERQLPAAIQFAKRFTGHRLVLDHIAKPKIKDGRLSPWDQNLRTLASFENVYCKVSGLLTEADWGLWTPRDLRPFLDIVFEAFGPKRIMIGSDWPVCTAAGSYEDSIWAARDYINRLSEIEQIRVTEQNARRAYTLKD